MKRLVLISLILTSSLAGAALAQETHRTKVSEVQCLTEARALVTHSHKYRNASVRQKQVMLSALNPELKARMRACRS